jgi:hypothetical protein
MANNFNNAGISGVSTDPNSPSTVYTSTNIKSIVIELDIANTGTNATSVSALLYDSSASQAYHIVKDAPLPSGSTIKVISGQKVVLNSNDEIRVYAASATVDAIISILEDVA